MAINTVNGKSALSGHSLAHVRLSASQKGLLIAQAARGEDALKSSASQLARGLGVSQAIASLAGRLQGHPALEAEVAAGRLSVTAAVKRISAAAKAPVPPMPPATE